MNQETFNLKWKFHTENITSTLSDEVKENNFADVTLVSDEMISYKVHKFVLSANSSVMKRLLIENPHPDPVIYLLGVQQQELQVLLQLMYHGEATFFTKRMDKLLKVTNEFQLNGFQLPYMTKQIKQFYDKK